MDDNVHWKFEYNITDHLGNVRAVFAAHSHGQPELMQQTSYYPFGMTKQQQNFYGPLSEQNKMLYNSKELQDDVIAGINFDWYDYGARFYDAQIGRWHVVDPLAEKGYQYSPYTYAFNNPLRFDDPDGRYGRDRIVYEYQGENTHTITTYRTERTENEDGSFTETRTVTTTTFVSESDPEKDEGIRSDLTSQTVTTGVRDADGNYEQVSSETTTGITKDRRSDMETLESHNNAVTGVRDFAKKNPGLSLTQDRKAMNEVIGGIAVITTLTTFEASNFTGIVAKWIGKKSPWVAVPAALYWGYDYFDRKYGNHEGRKLFLGTFP